MIQGVPMPNDRSKEVLTTGQVAKICKVAPRTVAKWFDSGQLRGYRIPGSKDRRIPLNQLVRFMQAHGMPLEGLETGQVRVLILDEEHEFTTLLRDALHDEGGYSVDIAPTIFEAGVLTQRTQPHVMVIDVSLPGVQPRRLCQFVRTCEELQQIRLIAVSGAMTEGQGAAHLQNGFDAYLAKPFDVRQLTQAIDLVTAGVP
jgi:excisionase family DNA binding protein